MKRNRLTIKKPKLLVFFMTCFGVILSFTGNAQNVTLAVRQSEQLKINAPTSVFKVIAGSKIVLGKELAISGGSGTYQTAWSSSGWTTDSLSKTITVSPLDTTAYTFKIIDVNKCSAEQLFHVNVVTPLQIECKTTPISCFGKNDGSIRLAITGGAAPFTISWSNGKNVDFINNLAPGDYTVTVTDNMNQKLVKTVVLKETDQIRKVLNISICEGGSYKFAGNDLSTKGTTVSTFKTSGGCDSIVTLNLTVNPIYSNTINAQICEGSSYSFAGINRTTAGQYKNSLKTFNGCDSIITLNLTVNPVYTKTIEAQICQGAAYSFAGIDRTAAGQYKNTLKTKSGCDSTFVLNLTVNPLPDIPVITQKGDTLRSSSAIGNQWSKDGADIKDENKQIFVISSSGSYTVSVTNTSGCSIRSEAKQYIKTDVPMIKEADFTCTVFPNPTTGIFTVELVSDKSNLVVLGLLTMDGKLIAKKTTKHFGGVQSIEFGSSNLAGGIYLLQIKFGSQIVSQKIIIN